MDRHRIGAGGTSVKGKKAAGILFTDGKSILLLKRAGEGDHIDKWGLPGGKAKEGETEIGNAVRETLEETGVKTIPGYRFNSMITKNGKQKFTTFFYHVAKPFDVHLSKEHSESKWADFDALSSLDLHPKLKEHIPDFLRIIRRKMTNFSEWVMITESINNLI